MISNRCTRKSLVTNCNSIISKNYLRFLVDSNDTKTETIRNLKMIVAFWQMFIIVKNKRLPCEKLQIL